MKRGIETLCSEELIDFSLELEESYRIKVRLSIISKPTLKTIWLKDHLIRRAKINIMSKKALYFGV